MSAEENTPRRPGEIVLTQDFLNAVARRYRCHFCGSIVSDPKWWGPHSGGWIVEGVNQRVWVYFECLGQGDHPCHQQWGLNHIQKVIIDTAWAEVKGIAIKEAAKLDESEDGFLDGLPGGN
jgi:hypothetical protein